MATSSATLIDDLHLLVTKLRSSASALETFATTLHRQVASLRWEGPTADKFRTAVKQQEALLAQANTLSLQLASRIQALVEDAKALEAKLSGEENTILQHLKKEISALEALAKSTGVPVTDLLTPQLKAALVKEGDHYQTVAGELTALGAS